MSRFKQNEFGVQSSADEIKIRRVLLTVFLVAASVFLAWFGLSRKIPLVGLLIPGVAIVSWLLSRPEVLLMVTLFMQGTNMKFPGLPDTLRGFEFAEGLLIGWAILDAALRKRKSRDSYNGSMGLWLALFIIDLCLIISVRGFGLALGGGSLWGGASYVTLLLSIFFFFSAVRIRLRPEQIPTLLWAMLAGGVVMSLVEILASQLPGTFFWLNQFFSTSAEQIQAEGILEDGIRRFSGANKVAAVLVPLAFVLCKKPSLQIFWLILSLALVAMSGFRGAMFSTGMLIFMLSVYDSKSRFKTIFIWCCIGLAVLAFLMVVAPMLPRAMQRAVSFIKFIPVDLDIAQRAEESSNWRFDMWRDYCIPNVPKYILVGRGMAYEIGGFAWLQSSWYITGDFFYQMGRYHSGPFSLLLDYGLLGTVSFTAFFLLAIREGWATLRRFKAGQEETTAYRFYAYLTIYLSYRIVSFYMIFGDVRESMPQLLVLVVLMRIVRKNLLEPVAVAGVQVVEDLNDLPTALNQGNRWSARSIGAKH
jgi:hypothetical protein